MTQSQIIFKMPQQKHLPLCADSYSTSREYITHTLKIREDVEGPKWFSDWVRVVCTKKTYVCIYIYVCYHLFKLKIRATPSKMRCAPSALTCVSRTFASVSFRKARSKAESLWAHGQTNPFKAKYVASCSQKHFILYSSSCTSLLWVSEVT